MSTARSSPDDDRFHPSMEATTTPPLQPVDHPPSVPLLQDEGEGENCHENRLIMNSDEEGGGPRPKRPISYPWGPETEPFEQRESVVRKITLAKRYSDPSPPTTTALQRKGTARKAQVKPFTKESIERLEKKTIQLVREYGFQPRRKLSVEDGSRLPAKYEPFPSRLYGRPLEEIDNFIYDEVIAGLTKSKVVVVDFKLRVCYAVAKGRFVTQRGSCEFLNRKGQEIIYFAASCVHFLVHYLYLSYYIT